MAIVLDVVGHKEVKLCQPAISIMVFEAYW